MSVPTLKISLPLPFSMINSVVVHISPRMTVNDVIKVALQNSKDSNQILTSNYGLYVPTRFSWFLPSALIEDYAEILYSFNSEEQIQLIPKRLYLITFSCYKYTTTIQCGADQKIDAVIRRVIKIFAKENARFFSGDEWTCFCESEEVPESMTVSKMIKIGNNCMLKRAENTKNGKKTSKNIFGEPLASSMSHEKKGAKIPTFLEECFRIIENKTEEEGIFRKNGSQTNVEHLSRKINECNDTTKIRDMLKCEDVHDITSLIKLYFRSTPDPLIPFKIYPVIQTIIQGPENNERLYTMKRILLSFPQLNFRIIGRFMECIKKILKACKINKMTIVNIAICISAIVMKNPDTQANPLEANSIAQKILTDIIKNSGYYFNNEEIMEQSSSAYCIRTIDDGEHHELYEGCEVEIVDKEPKDNQGCYLISYKGEKFYEPADAFEIIEKNIDDIYHPTVVDPDFIFSEGAPLFLNGMNMMGSKKTLDFLTSLGEKADDRLKKIEQCLAKLDDPGDADVNEIVWELSQLIETDIC